MFSIFLEAVVRPSISDFIRYPKSTIFRATIYLDLDTQPFDHRVNLDRRAQTTPVALQGMLFALWWLAIVIALACLRILGEPVSPIVRRPGFLRLSFITINLVSNRGSYLCEQQSDLF
jgi:hypothetical protein